MEDFLVSSAEKYDFGKGFFQPSRAQMLDQSPGQNFGLLLSSTLRQQMRVHHRPEGRFDAVRYFIHFFMGIAFSAQQSKKFRRDFKIDKIFYRIVTDQKLKMFVVTSDDKVMMKCVTFGRDEQQENPHDWSDEDFVEIASKIGPDAKSYKFESHNYDVKFIDDTSTTDAPLAFFIKTEYELSVKLKPGHIRSAQRRVESHFQELPAIGEKEGAMFVEDYFDGMFSNPENKEAIKQFAKDFSNQVILNFRKYSKSKVLPTEANAGFMHGFMFLYHKKYNFKPEIIQQASQSPTVQFRINVQKNFNSEWSHILYDYPCMFHIVDVSRDMDIKEVEKRALSVMVENQGDITVTNTFSDKVLMTFLNFNAQVRTVAQNELKVRTFEVFDPLILLRGIASYLKDKFKAEEANIPIRDTSDYLRSALQDGILKQLADHGLCSQGSRCLSRYMHGLLSSGEHKAYTIGHSHGVEALNDHTTSFLLETDEPDLQVLLTLHEGPQAFPEDFVAQLESNPGIVPYLNENAKYIAHFHVVVSHNPRESGGPALKVHTYFKPILPNHGFIMERINHLSLRNEAPNVEAYGHSPDTVEKINQFLTSKLNLFSTYEEFASFAMGNFHDLQILYDVVKPGPNTIQLVYLATYQGGKGLIATNFIFGGPKEVIADLGKLSKLNDETKNRKMSNLVRLISFIVTKNPNTGERVGMVLAEKGLGTLKVCGKFQRSKRSACEREDLKVLADDQPVTDTSMEVSEKVKFFSKLGKISSGVMTGMMVKNLIADLVEGNVAGVATNTGFILANLLASAASVKILANSGQLTKEGRLLLGATLKASASFVARSPSFLFIGYDLYNNLYSNDSSIENKVAIGTDSAYLAIDLAESVIELAEIFGVVEGVSAVTGPIGWALGAALIIGSDVYRAVEQVEKLNAMISLSPEEEIMEGLRGFLGLKPSGKISNMISAKKWNDDNIQQAINAMSKINLNRYVASVKTTANYLLDNYMNFTAPKEWIKVSRVVPQLQHGFTYFCSTPYDCKQPTFWEIISMLFAPKVLVHICTSAVGIQNPKTVKSGRTYYQLLDGKDVVVAFKDDSNIFELGNGEKIIQGGNKDDIFFLRGGEIRGFLDGGRGKNVLNAAHLTVDSDFVVTSHSIYSQENSTIGGVKIVLRNFHQYYGRKNLNDMVVAWCELSRINTFGGSSGHGRDYILIPNSNCTINLSMNIFSETTVLNRACFGNFIYQIGDIEYGMSVIDIQGCESTTTHFFTLDYNLYDFSAVWTRWKKKVKKIFLRINNSTRILIKSKSWQNVKFVFKDKVNFHFDAKHAIAVLDTAQDLAIAEDFYASVISASTISMIIRNTNTKETLTLSRGRHHKGRLINVLYSGDDRKTRLRGSSVHENVFSIMPHQDPNSTCLKFHDVFVKITKSRNLIDLMRVQNAALAGGSHIKLNAVSRNDDSTTIYVSHSNARKCDNIIGKIIIDNQNAADSIVFMTDGPMTLKFHDREPYLESPPVYFNKSQSIIILSDHGIQANTKLIIDKELGRNFTFYTYNNTLVLTNIHPRNDLPCGWIENISNDSIAIFLVDYKSEVMKSLIFKFRDMDIALGSSKPSDAKGIEMFEQSFDLIRCLSYSIMRIHVPIQ